MITSTSNPKIKYVRRLMSDRRYRQREKAFVVEGERWLSELYQSAIQPLLILATEEWSSRDDRGDLIKALDAPVFPSQRSGDESNQRYHGASRCVGGGAFVFPALASIAITNSHPMTPSAIPAIWEPFCAQRRRAEQTVLSWRQVASISSTKKY